MPPRTSRAERAEADLPEIDDSLWETCQSLEQIGDLLTCGAAIDLSTLWHCTEAADGVMRILTQTWDALSDFRGANLEIASVEPSHLEDLDGVRWSDGTAGKGATRWPSTLIAAVVDHSDAPARAVPGEFVVRVGLAAGLG
jgi:hypothetical protein